MKTREWYFVRRLRESERLNERLLFEIQVLDDDGLAVAVGYIGCADEDLEIDGFSVPRAVLQSAKRRLESEGEYIGADGRSISPF